MATSISRKKEPARKAPAKNTSLSDREYVSQIPAEEDIAVLQGGARYLPIDVVERDLDRWVWSTQNFKWLLYDDKFRNRCIGADLELIIFWKNEDGTTTERRLIGVCNFVVGNYVPNGHIVATAKSECVKNAASDLGKKFGRGLNEGFMHSPVVEKATAKSAIKMIPEKSIIEKFKKAVEEGDETMIKIYSDIYEFNTEQNGN